MTARRQVGLEAGMGSLTEQTVDVPVETSEVLAAAEALAAVVRAVIGEVDKVAAEVAAAVVRVVSQEAEAAAAEEAAALVMREAGEAAVATVAAVVRAAPREVREAGVLPAGCVGCSGVASCQVKSPLRRRTRGSETDIRSVL